MPLNFWQYCANAMPLLLDGLVFSLTLFSVVAAVSFPLSIVLAVLKISGPRWVKAVLGFYTWIFRGTPLLIQLFLVYYGLPYVGVILPTNVVIFSIFILSASAYEIEVIRGGLISIDKGHYEACHVLGMSYIQTLRRVVIPQTIRKVLPPTCSEAIILFKDTSLVTAIAVFDLLRHARNLVFQHGRIDAFVVALFFYLVISSILTITFTKLEKRFPAQI
ncbi:MAG: amino acid ABC transporter permease [Clostridia bacterium]|nr:amino acid ABC transporter permease [Clostridia bacterium]